ncbi:hypothetical protein SPRG_12113 [Saprolegnia parasitica CBS 223.65]|uniref:Uncharacterized protein n=1 Tax=Saprolegnia parasitica (strain CBS 223.65) TaxID=695850 RepID=A0A067BUU7_SAPPC|nr:hypothetical protein SPRG_12113 [Saprolegnia parasitica CBS 223.65]KDO22274.1 hypothetical protein SPRG_12113 [Saprolegnia parasitica CBS 223.65]|eukprot:XP_012207009.1 hypothetical protein SPRG_12113 [Saprolegnia parasitica CBS 223.65]
MSTPLRRFAMPLPVAPNDLHRRRRSSREWRHAMLNIMGQLRDNLMTLGLQATTPTGVPRIALLPPPA